MDNLKYFRFDALLQQQGWVKPGYVGVTGNGTIQYLSEIQPTTPGALEIISGVVIPGIPNAHSHAFQYAMAGMAEKHQPGSQDDFWSWREGMYECALAMQPDQIEAVAAMLYSEMLRKGYTHVAEFHYLHHDTNGKPYQNLSETGEHILSAAATAGIKITLIPIFYQNGGFGIDPELRQRRFISRTTDQYFSLLDATRTSLKNFPSARLGFGVHSLRAVSANDVFKTFQNGPKDLPFHIHAAEQIKEVEASTNFLKQRPVEWLLNNLPLNDRFNLVHCTHMNGDEIKRLAHSGANVVLCPGTEGNLGDGIFPLSEFSQWYGSWAIGTDSHISLNPFEDLRWLDYCQRLTTHKRNTFDDGATVLMNKVIPSGRKSMGCPAGNFFELNSAFDAVVMKPSVLINSEHLLPSIIYTADSSSILGTIIDGKWQVTNQMHINGMAIRSKYEKVMRELIKSS
jgi:formimidoylglutamate deiminase